MTPMRNNPQTVLDFDRLQRDQQAHDVRAHQDILSQLIPKRLTHFTLHFAKYQGALVRAQRASDSSAKLRLLVDSFVIALASANAMNLRLRDRLGELREPPQKITPYAQPLGSELLMQYVEVVGDMAKACEVMDHAEDYPSRQVLERSILKLMGVIEQMAASEGIDLVTRVYERWAGIEKKCFLSVELPAPGGSRISTAA